MEIVIGFAKAKKHATTGNGDGLTVMARPSGGVTAILADGHGGGRSVSGISTTASLKAAHLIADGVQDSFIPRSIYDYFCSIKEINFTVALTLLSADLEVGKLIICRNSNSPVLIRHEFGVDIYDEPSQMIGAHKSVKPQYTQVNLDEGMIAVAFSDGVLNAGHRRGRFFDIKSLERLLIESRPQDAHYLAQSILDRALSLDSYQAADHMSVIVLGIDNKLTDNKTESGMIRISA